MKAVALRNNYGNKIAVKDAETGTIAATVAPFDPVCAADLTDDDGGLAALEDCSRISLRSIRDRPLPLLAPGNVHSCVPARAGFELEDVVARRSQVEVLRKADPWSNLPAT